MEQEHTSPYSHTLFDAGIDWITCTQARGLEGRQFRAVGEELMQQQVQEGRSPSRATLRDYVGWRGEHLFTGTREDDAIIVASADVAARHWQTIARAARNVSRLDLQASVWTHGEQPSLARWSYHKLKRAPAGRGRPRSFTLIRTHPQGETLNVGKRASDTYGRLYDWASAHKQGEPQTIWRYEVEYKRHMALHHSSTLLGSSDPRGHIASTVHHWFESRGVRPTWELGASRFSNGEAMTSSGRDTLEWFRSSLSKTVAKQINRYGIHAVLSALGLSDLVRPVQQRNKSHATNTARPLPSEADRGASRPTD